MWFATWEGVARYNGRQFKVFARGETSGLPDSGVRGLTTDGEGLLVVGARGGVSRYQHQAWTPQPDADAMVNHVLRDANGLLWLATQNDGIYVRDGETTIRHISVNQGLPSNDVYQLVQDSAGRVWAGTAQGVAWIHDDQVQVVNGIPAVAAMALVIDDQGRILVGSEQGLFAIDNAGVTPLYVALTTQAIISILQDKNGDLWLGTTDRGLIRISQLGIEFLGVEQGLPEQRVVSLFQDNEDSIWVGTNGGLMRLRDVPFSSVTEQQGLAGNYVRTVLAHSDGSMWVGSSAGLTQIKNKQVMPLELIMEDGTEPSVLSLAEGSLGELWVGTFTHGLLQLVNGKLQAVYQREDGLQNNEVRAILPVADGSVWVGTARGLSKLQNQKIINYRIEGGLPGDFVMSLHQGTHGEVWVGTGRGAALIQNNTVTPVYLNSQENAEYAFSFYSEPNGEYVWISTDRGLVRYRYADASLSVVGLKHGLPVEKIFQLVPDQLSGLWLTSNRGVTRIDLAAAHRVADGLQSRIEFEHFGESDGMATSQANGGSEPAATIANDGSVWIATALGVSRVQPTRLFEFSRSNLPVVFESVTVAGEAQPVSSEVVLAPGSGRLQLGFAGLGFVLPERIEYRTLLEGFDDEWVMRGQQNMAEYTNLPPGTYRFRVTAAYPYDNWSQQEASLTVTVLPFIWQLPLFWIVIGSLVLAILWLLMRLRVQLLNYHTTELTRQVADKTKKLRQQAQAFELQAREDPLTKLPNRRAFDERLITDLARAQRSRLPVSLMVIDIDHFKRVNDNWSHAVGDLVIKAVAMIIRQQVRTVDFPARWGGEEFTVLLPDTDTNVAYDVAERLRKATADYDYSQIADGLRLTISIGLAKTDGNMNEHQLLAQADTALYQAKNQGRNQVVIFNHDDAS